MQHTFLIYISLILIILFLVMLAEKLKVAYPIILVLGGLLLSFFDGTRFISINPDLIFIIFLPPLLYEAAWDISWKNLWRWRRVILSFAFLIVLVTSLVVALVSSWLIPGFTLALGFLLGGIVSPPDAVSAGSVMRYVKISRGMSAIIEGESLMNDASSLIVFRFALIAVDTGRFVFHEAALSFVLVIVMGVAIGLAVALVYYAIYKWLPTSTNMDIVLSLTAPYVMYIAAESFHVSGVLAVVSGGLFLSVKSHLYLSQRSRLRGANVWSTLGFVLNGLIFMLIGLQLPNIVGQLGDVRLSQAIGYGLLITGVLVVGRLLSTLGASAFTVWVSKYITTADSRPGWRNPIIFGWAGMRGVVSLAAALSIPLYLHNGAPFPQRNLILFITFMVILLTLVVQGLTLPLVIRWVRGGENRDITLPHKEQELLLRKKLSHYSLQFLDDQHRTELEHNRPLQQLRERFANDQLPQDDNAGVWHEDYRRIYLQLLEIQRDVLHKLNRKNELDDEIIRKYLTMLDLEEEKLRMKFEGA
ncbi:MAG: Na+/H+ antiporter [Chitinophagaceae bacterium]|nr:Na+/H+ antiporter [Chitinophagaceae bacterium]